MSLYRAKGDELSEKDLKQLGRVFGTFGFTAEEIKKKFGTGGKKRKEIDPSEVLDKTQARNVQNFMQQLDMKEKLFMTSWVLLLHLHTISCAKQPIQ